MPIPVMPDHLPVTVSVTRRADPGHVREMTAWIRAGLSMAEGFPGFLGEALLPWITARLDWWSQGHRFRGRR